MKRLSVVLIVVAISMLVVVAPASAAKTLTYQFVSGEANGVKNEYHPATVDLVVTGTVYLHTSTFGAVNLNGQVSISAPVPKSSPDQYPPFPVKIPMADFHWVWGWWNDDGTIFTAQGRWVRPTLPPFTADLVATTGPSGTLTVTIQTVGSAWGWDSWVLNAVLK